jgi:ubiquinone/menaquinone biosynthesis C-methylase UbiE
LLTSKGTELEIQYLAQSLYGAPDDVVKRIKRHLPAEQQDHFRAMVRLAVTRNQVQQAREYVLNALFWDLTYWKNPQMYHTLTEGESLHPGIFEQLEPDIRDHIVLDAAAGSGRATFECLRSGARLVYAIDPAPGLLHVLEHRLQSSGEADRVVLRQGSFDHLPLETNSVDLALSCSAFLSKETQGGESGLAELWRVTKSGGKIVIIWPLPPDYQWFASHGFQYRLFPPLQEPMVRFRSMESALQCVTRFYAKRPECIHYLQEHGQPEIPYALLGFKQPNDYCWLAVEKEESL